MTTQYNIVSYGTLTNTNGVLSDFSASNYAAIPLTFNPVQHPYEIVFKVNTGTMPTNANGIIWQTGDYLTARGRLDLEVYEDKLYAEYAANGDLVSNIDGVTTLSSDTDYWVKFTYDGIDTYGLYLSTDGTTWTTEGTTASSGFLGDGSAEYNIIGVQPDEGGMIVPWFGSIDLNESYIAINNIRWWQGVTSTSNVQTRIQLRHDTAANWTSVNPVLLEGEVGIETDTRKQKVGDGATAWNSLSYQNEIFIAEYNVTSWNDIVSAYNSGKTIICKYPQEGISAEIFNYPQYSLNCIMDVRKDTGNLVRIEFCFESCRIFVNSTEWSKLSDSILRGASQNDTEYIYPGSQYFGVLSTNDYTTVYNLIDTTNGLIPDARISSNIARTSAIPDISTKQDTLVSGTNIKTINNTSLLGSGNIDTSQIFFAQYGTTTTTQISQALGDGKAIFCIKSVSSADYIYYYSGTATIGGLSAFTFSRTYQNTTEVVYVSSITNQWNTITKTLANDDLSNVSSIDANSAVATALDAKVNKSGDTMTGALELNVPIPSGDNTTRPVVLKNTEMAVGTVPSSATFTTLQFTDTNDAELARMTLRNTTTERELVLVNTGFNGSTTTLKIGMNTSNTPYCTFPNTTCVDGQWIILNQGIITSDTNANGSSYLGPYTVNVPNDGHNYEIIVQGQIRSGTTIGNWLSLTARTSLMSLTLAQSVAKTASALDNTATGNLVLSSDRQLWIERSTSFTGYIRNFYVRAYRRIGTNS